MAATGPTASPWVKRAMEMVEHGPVEKERLLSYLIGLVPPGRGWREYLRVRMRNQRRYFGYEELSEEDLAAMKPDEEHIRYGQRQIVIASLAQQVKMGRMTRENREDGSVWYGFGREMKKIPPEVISERIRQINASRSPEERSAISRKGAESRTPEQRAEAARKGWRHIDAEQRRQVARARALAMPAELRKERARRAVAGRSPEERSAAARKGWFQRDAETRRRQALQGWQTRREKPDQQEGRGRATDTDGNPMG